MSQYNQVEVSKDQTSYGCSYWGEDGPDHDTISDSFNIEDPIRGKVDKYIDEHVYAGDKRYNCLCLMISFGDGDWDGWDNNPACTVDET